MDSIKITGNNGSVPDNYFKQFELIFHSDGKSTFKLTNGRDEDAAEVISESKQFQPKEIEKMIHEAERLQLTKVDKPNVGGPQKKIVFHADNKETVLEIQPTEIEALRFINQCLSLFNSGLPNRLVDFF